MLYPCPGNNGLDFKNASKKCKLMLMAEVKGEGGESGSQIQKL